MARNVEYTIVHGPEWQATVDALREVDETLSDKFRAALEEAARPTIEQLRRAALALPAHKAKHTGLRGRIAAGVGITVQSRGVRITTSMPAGQEELPRGEDNGLRGWRHPVFGNRDVWVSQHGGSWFKNTISDDRPNFEHALGSVLDKACNDIDRATRL